MNNIKEAKETVNYESPITTWETIYHIACVLASSFNPILAIFGFVLSGLSCFLLVSDFYNWSTLIKFSSVLISAITGGYIIGRFGNILFMLLIICIIIGVTLGSGVLIWQSLE